MNVLIFLVIWIVSGVIGLFAGRLYDIKYVRPYSSNEKFIGRKIKVSDLPYAMLFGCIVPLGVIYVIMKPLLKKELF